MIAAAQKGETSFWCADGVLAKEAKTIAKLFAQAELTPRITDLCSTSCRTALCNRVPFGVRWRASRRSRS